MTRTEYLRILQEKLERFNMELQREIMEDYEQHFAEGLSLGKTEEEIIQELGSIEDMIQAIPEQDNLREMAQTFPEENVNQESEGRAYESAAYEGIYRQIAVQGMMADVILEKSTDGKVNVEYENNGSAAAQQRYRLYHYEQNGVLYVGIKDCGSQEKKKLMLFGKTILTYDGGFEVFTDMQLRIGIPEGVDTLEASVSSGDIEVKDINVGKLTVKSASGDAEIENIKTRELWVQTASGDMELSNVMSVTTNLQAASGDIDADNVMACKLSAGTGSGDVAIVGGVEECTIKTGSGEVELQAERGAKSITVSTGSGDVSIDIFGVNGVEIFANTGSGEYSLYGADGSRQQGSGGSFHMGSGDCKVNVRTGSGDAEVRCH